MISTKLEEYDGRIIVSREKELQRDNDETKESIKLLWGEIGKHSRILNEWKWPIKIVLGMLTTILIGVAGIVVVILKHGVADLLK